jgi:hypothetical protein
MARVGRTGMSKEDALQNVWILYRLSDQSKYAEHIATKLDEFINTSQTEKSEDGTKKDD